MSLLLSKYLPYILLLFMLFCAIKKPIYLLGVPFLIFFQYCIFFDTVRLFAIPNSISKDVLFLIWLCITWIILSSRSFFQIGYKRLSLSHYKGANPINLPIYGLLLISFVGLLSVLTEYTIITDVVNEFFVMISLFAGYFIIKDIIQHTNTEALKDFFYTIVIINSLASLLYFIHQGLHITLYQPPWAKFEPQEELFGGQFVTREFWCMPVLWYFSIAYLIIFRKKRTFINLILLAINFLGIFISYTRSALIIGFIVIFIYFILASYKKRSISILIKNIAVTAFIVSTLFFIVYYFLPKKTDYFVSRMNELKQNPKDEESNDLLFRFSMTGEVFNKMKPAKRIAGMGPVTETQLRWVEDMRNTTSDMAWAGVVFRWGYLGLVFFILLFILSLIKAFTLFMQSDGLLSQLALLFFLTILSQILESFVSSTFMNPSHFAMGLWYFGVLSALIGFNKQPQPEVIFYEEYQVS